MHHILRPFSAPLLYQRKPFALVILDGFGYRSDQVYRTLLHRTMPHYTAWQNEYPHTLLKASGAAVGLPEHVLPNSEVGHMTLGAGKIIPQAALIIQQAIANNTLTDNPILRNAFRTLHTNRGTLHVIGLLSDAGVHSMQSLLYALLDVAATYGLTKIYIHPILDGRDTPPESAAAYLEQLEQYIKTKKNMRIGSIEGRFYAMDRDLNWDRTSQSIACLTQKQPAPFKTWQEALTYYYNHKITDEFIPPTQFDTQSIIAPESGVIFFNFRSDRAQQLTQRLLETVPHLSFFITPFKFDDPTPITLPLFAKPTAENTLLEQLNEHNLRIFTIAETEKRAPVTYFFKGGKNIQLKHETTLFIPSLKERTYANNPQMSAPAITQAVLDTLSQNPYDFYLINYANADMVGHSGNALATGKALICLDEQLMMLYRQLVERMNGTMIITADHGNAEAVFDAAQAQPHTAHTHNVVPFLAINRKWQHKAMPLSLTSLADVAPFIIKTMTELKTIT